MLQCFHTNCLARQFASQFGHDPEQTDSGFRWAARKVQARWLASKLDVMQLVWDERHGVHNRLPFFWDSDVVGYHDATVIECTEVGGPDVQRAFYSGKHRKHCVKVMTVLMLITPPCIVHVRRFGLLLLFYCIFYFLLERPCFLHAGTANLTHE
jgi:hypothetical protein